ncbi:hypothetical protein BIV57_10785 [Mangrovactinospora gilvigrisea]|uniref:Roadblock/LAMTOR2 domain-containing protein n=1 Tax=Mangrovactinospora gilvigrisea TaxID=1428644 RepID=A0A1J7BFL8_9ACTN|nr:roadblock/LC7 domain-containing protein [Mangrovactinospora gilvigrisea]OIV37446.1 hypothetical protein BIV57_10785 [Mangrovactinospora gilvigrisea]
MTNTDITFLLTRYQEQNPGVTRVVALTLDGLVQAHTGSADLDGTENARQAAAERLAAASSGLLASAHAIAKDGGKGKAKLVIIQAQGGEVYLVAAHHACLVIETAPGYDSTAVMNNANTLIDKVGEAIAQPARPTTHPVR